MMAGTDPVALHWFGLALLEKADSKFGHNKQKSLQYIEHAEKYGLGTRNSETTQI